LADPNKVDPIHQFQITDIVSFGEGGISFTNSALFMVLSVGVIALYLLLSTQKRSLVPGRAQLGRRRCSTSSSPRWSRDSAGNEPAWCSSPSCSRCSCSCWWRTSFGLDPVLLHGHQPIIIVTFGAGAAGVRAP
jgi:hypothetical protein